MSTPDRHRIVILTGMSGAGKSSALKLLEDLGYEAVDNLPLGLLPRITEGDDAPRRPIAIGLDSRTRGFRSETLAAKLDLLRGKTDVDVQLLFLDCDDEILHNRFTATRRVHPLAQDRAVSDGITLERSLLLPIRERADLVIDTSRLKLPELRDIVGANFTLAGDQPMNVLLVSFSYRLGLPREADLVFDVRFLSNPFYESALRPKSGEDAEVAAFIERDSRFPSFFAALSELLRGLLPAYAAAGKHYLTVALGCTGGRHRSVMVAKKLSEALASADYRIALRHRDIHLGGE